MTVLDSFPPRPLDGDTVLALNESDTGMVVLPISYYEEVEIYSMTIFTDDRATIMGFNGEQWEIIQQSEADGEDEFEPEQAVDEWMRETHPALYDDPAFEVTSDDYDLD